MSVTRQVIIAKKKETGLKQTFRDVLTTTYGVARDLTDFELKEVALLIQAYLKL